ncbi:MDR family MFS transporter [Paenibacillus sp. FSL K6-2859]|jgi:EmrB/QacA subfamily drug resistance transporter|uniref:MDR family MFS transporter n=1 Tax=Paenibacillus sp. FSL K6-2859 TaxID=2921482 RepID=UPI0030F7BFA6
MGKDEKLNLASAETFSLRAIIPQLLAIIVGMIMVILDSTAMNVAIPSLVKDLNSDLDTIKWTITGYTLAMSAVIPLAGWLSDRIGAKRVFLISITLFTIGSALCAIAQSPSELIVFRMLQGLGGGMVAPVGMAMVFSLAPPEKRGAVMGFLGIPILLGPALGPILSGYLVEYQSWHWIFLINLPVGIAAVIMIQFLIPKSKRSEKIPHLDWKGMILAPIAFAMLAYGISESGTSWTSTSTLTGLIVGGIALILFIISSLSQKQPLLELRVFRSSDFTRSILLLWVVMFAMFGVMVMVPLFLQNVKGYSALETGVMLLPQALMAGLCMPISGKLFDKIGARPLALIGLSSITAAMFVLSSVTVDTGKLVILIALGLMGVGMGFTMMPLNTHVMNSSPRHLVSRVTSLTTAAQQVVVSFAVTVLTTYLTSQAAEHLKTAGNAANPLESMVQGFGDTFNLVAWIAAAGILFALFLRKPKQAPDEGDGQNTPSVMIH